MEPERSCDCNCACQTRSGAPSEARVDKEAQEPAGMQVVGEAIHEAQPHWVTGFVNTPAGRVPVVSTRLTAADVVGGWKARWNIRRMVYKVSPGLYAVGSPGPADVALVTSNYKLSFDRLRQELGGRDAWILVLDTRGINVWCAAGKGLFSTVEIVERIRVTGLERVIAHRTLILPQLAAPGVSAQRVRQESGFNVVYGPVRAGDLPAFLDGGRKASPEMRTVRFSFTDRLILVPVELVSAMKYFLYYAAAALVFEFTLGPGSPGHLALLTLPVFGAVLVGVVLVPVLLPWVPFRSFTLKGWLTGLLWAVAASFGAGAGPVQFAGNLLLLPVLSAGFALNFTGATTFTSQTGVNKEIRLFARPMAIFGLLGAACLVVNLVR